MPKPTTTPAAPGKPAADTWKRDTSELLDTSLQAFTLTWMKNLPAEVRPLQCARHYPRVLNRIAAIWNLQERCLDYLEDLLVDRRGKRQGFGHGVHDELRRLISYRVALLPDDAVPTDFAPTVPSGLPPSSRS